MGDGLELVGRTGIGRAGVELARTCRPDVVLVGADGRDGHGLGLLPRIRGAAPAARIVVLSAPHPGLAMLTAALSQGADTCLDRADALAQLPQLVAALLGDGPAPGSDGLEVNTVLP